MSSTPYDGRHRGTSSRRSARRLPRSFSAGFALPTAAAAALALTATGATMADAGAVSLDLTGRQTAVLKARDAATQLSETTEQRQSLAVKVSMAQSRAEETQRAARSRERQALVAARAAVARQKSVAAAKAKAQAQAKAKAKAAAEAERTKWVLPIAGATFTSGFGMRWGRLHAGNDFGTPVGTPIAAMSSGEVIFAGSQGGYGNKVEIRYWDGTVSYYGHMNSIDVNVGDRVSPGDIIGSSGNTGHSTGPHLHLEIHPSGGGPVNPAPWLHAHGLQ